MLGTLDSGRAPCYARAVTDDADSGVPAADGRRAMEEIRFRVPTPWKRELQQAADAQAIDLGDLMRIISRGYLRERYSPDERAHLRVDP